MIPILFTIISLLSPPQVNTAQNLDTFFIQWKDGTNKEEILSTISGIETVNHYSNIPNLTLLNMEDVSSMKTAIKKLSSNSNIEFIEEDRWLTAIQQTISPPNDPGFSLCWGLNNNGSNGGVIGWDMSALGAWSITTGNPSVKIMIIETGVDENHSDLNLEIGRDFTTGVVNGIPGGNPSNSCDNHGTAVAGCISAKINNQLGTVGIAPNCKVVSAKVGIAITPCNGSWNGQTSWTVNALNWAISAGIRVTNNSNDYGVNSNAMSSAYAASRNAGIIHFASAGNGGTQSLGFPARLTTVNAVGSASRNQTKSSFSSYGSGLAFVAPGQSIYTTDRTGSVGYNTSNWVTVDGTSFSSPYAAGVAALLISLKPSITPVEIESAMNSTASDMQTTGYDIFTGWGMINAEKALKAILPSICKADINNDSVVDGNDMGMLLSLWGTTNSMADLNNDNIVDGTDLGLLLSAWGPC
jgi:subtilisin family serine protease